MKTPEEIKKGLEVCATLDGDCESCPYDDRTIHCSNRLRKDALAYIQQLESRLAQVEREKDAAVDALYGECEMCFWDDNLSDKCLDCIHNENVWMPNSNNWQWRGVCEENAKEDGSDERKPD